MALIPVRAVVGAMIFLGYFVSYLVRYNISVHIIDMLQLPGKHYERPELMLVPRQPTSHSLRSIISMLDWGDMKMAKLLSAYFIGYCICFPIFHNWGDKWGPTWLAGVSGMMSGALNCLTPIAAYTSFWLLVLVRIGTGFCAGATLPCMVQVLRHWVPPVERNHFMWAYCGLTAGTFSTFLFCAGVQYNSRWVVGFYTTGALQMTWAVMWVALVSDHPRKHPFLPEEERQYLESAIGEIFTIRIMNTSAPWNIILRTVEFWALVMLNFGYAWMIMSVCLYGPLYYSEILGYNIYKAAVVTSIPFLLRLVLGTVVIQVFHWFKHTKRSQRIQLIRKVLILISHVLPGMLITSLWCFQVAPGPVLLTTAVALTAAGMDLTLDICYEMAPTYANSLNTVIKIIGNTPGIFVSFCVGGITHTYGNSLTTWKHLWCFHGAVILVSGVVFLVWGDAGLQPWNSVRAYSPQRQLFKARPSTMSRISELDEEDPSVRQASVTSKKKSRPSSIRPLKI